MEPERPLDCHVLPATVASTMAIGITVKIRKAVVRRSRVRAG
jgi:hypothetical protein